MSGLTFKSKDGLELVGELDAPEVIDAALVICHAHPNMGGTMKSPLLIALRDAMLARHYAVLRFNFRGVEGSEGEPTTGAKETADAHGAVDLMKERFAEVPIAIAGWSFGGGVAIKTAAARHDLSACVAIAPAVKEKPGVMAGLPTVEELATRIPLLVVVGADDDLTPPKDCRAWAEGAGARYVEISAANHFFWAKYDPLTEAVAGFLEEVV